MNLLRRATVALVSDTKDRKIINFSNFKTLKKLIAPYLVMKYKILNDNKVIIRSKITSKHYFVMFLNSL